VSIDINSGRSTREHNIEQTAFHTNVEAAAEIARQLRLRDMAGLVVIDFIDMEQSSHVRKVEKAMKDALKNDRARIQVGRISSFGLMEMSRQRLRTGVLEASTKACPHCEGTGLMRTASSAGLSALHIIEDEAARGRGDRILLRAGREAAIYLLNKKRGELAEIEARYGVTVEVMIEESFEGARMSVESSGPRPMAPPRQVQEAPPIVDEDEDDIVEDEEEDEEEESQRGPREPRDREESEGGRRRRRRRRGGRGRRREGEGEAPSEGGEDAAIDEGEEAAVAAEPFEGAEAEAEEKPKSRRGRRGGRGRGRRDEGAEQAAETVEPDSSPMVETPTADEEPIAEAAPAEEAKPVPSEAEGPKTRRRPRARAKVAAIEVTEPAPAEAPPAETAGDAAPEEKPKPKRKPRARKATADEASAEAPAEPAVANDENGEEIGDDGEPRRGGWWQRTFG
jgi:ribonuclease E